MSQPYVGEIRMFAGNFAPWGWMLCEGQLLPISEYETLFNLIGTTYGGDGQETFALPDLRGRIPIHQGNGFVLAENGGVEEVTLTVNQIPSHTHNLIAASGTPQYTHPHNSVLGQSAKEMYRDTLDNVVVMANNSLSSNGGSQPHTNMMPILCVNFIISIYGIFPSPT